MSQFQIYVVNAFTDKTFGGNQSGVMIVEEFPSDEMLKNIVKESNLSEISFIKQRQRGSYDIRWFSSKT